MLLCLIFLCSFLFNFLVCLSSLFFFFFCLPLSCHSLLLPAWPAAGLPACCISSSSLQTSTLLCDQPPAVSQTPSFPAYNPCWPTLRSAAALGSSQHFTVAACLCCVSVLLSLLKKVWHQKGRSLCLCSRRLFKAACCIIEKCFHQVISSLPSLIFFHHALGSTPNLLLCAEPFALSPAVLFSGKGQRHAHLLGRAM